MNSKLESFGLYETEEPIPGWEKSVFEKRDEMERQAKIDDLQNCLVKIN